MSAYLILTICVVLLFVCGDALVRGSVALSLRLGIPTIVVGLTVVAFGTSAPELVVSMRAALTGVPDIALGNVVGSNIANVLLILGLPALISKTDCAQPLVVRNTVIVVLGTVFFIFLCFLRPLGFWHGLILVALLFAFLLESARHARSSRSASAVLGEEVMETIDNLSGLPKSTGSIITLILIGLIGLPLAAHFTVSSALEIAVQMGISHAAVGLTFIAIGTSLPELATTLPAALRGHAGLALGNILGSNIFNLFAVMGFTAMVAPIPVSDRFLTLDLWIMLLATLALVPFVYPVFPFIKSRHLTRFPAFLFVASYVCYVYFILGPRQSDTANSVVPTALYKADPFLLEQK